jgi:hypothetical protein
MTGWPSGPITGTGGCIVVLASGPAYVASRSMMFAQQDFFFIELAAPDDDCLEGERALAQAGDHGVPAGLDALGDGNLALARD